MEIFRLEANLNRELKDFARGITATLLPNIPGLNDPDSAGIQILDPTGAYKNISIPFSQVSPESLRQYQITGDASGLTLLDQFGDVDRRRIQEIVPLVTRMLERNPALFEGGDEKLANAIKQAIEDANLAGSVIIDNSQTDNSTDIKPTQPSPGNPGHPEFIGPMNEPALVLPG